MLIPFRTGSATVLKGGIEYGPSVPSILHPIINNQTDNRLQRRIPPLKLETLRKVLPASARKPRARILFDPIGHRRAIRPCVAEHIMSRKIVGVLSRSHTEGFV